MSVLDLADAAKRRWSRPTRTSASLRSGHAAAGWLHGAHFSAARRLGSADRRHDGVARRVDGATRVLFEAPPTDAVLQTCVSPGTRYLAVLVAPDAISNPYDTYQLPLPERLETRVFELADGAEVVALAGSSISWCQVPPS